MEVNDCEDTVFKDQTGKGEGEGEVSPPPADDGLLSLVWDFFAPRRAVLDVDSSIQDFAVQRKGIAQRSVAGKSKDEIIEDINFGLEQMEKETDEGEKEMEEDDHSFGTKCAHGASKKKGIQTSREEYRVLREDIEALFGSRGMDEKNILASLEERERKIREKQKRKRKKKKETEIKEFITSNTENAKRQLTEDVEDSKRELLMGERRSGDQDKGKEKIKESTRKMDNRELLELFAHEEGRARFKEASKQNMSLLSAELDDAMQILTEDVREMRREVNDQRNLLFY